MIAARSIVLGLGLGVALAGCTPSPHAIAGRYVEHIEARDNPPWRDLIGDFEFDFRDDGELHVHQVGGTQVDAIARWRLDGDVLTIAESGGQTSCRESGLDLASAAYRVHYLGDGIELRALRDECRGRREAIPLKPLRRID